MVFYAFALDELYAAYQRGHVPDTDVVTFTLYINDERRGWLAGRVPAVTTGSRTPFAACQVDTRGGSALFANPARTAVRLDPVNHWILGPVEVAPADLITLVVTGTNTSDSELSDQDAEQFEIAILDAITRFVIEAGVGMLPVGGLLGGAVDKFLKTLTDPAGAFLDWHRRGPCDGQVFTDTHQFTGGQLAAFDYTPPPTGLFSNDVVYGLEQTTHTLPIHHVTDEQNHDTSTCGHIAETELTLSAIRLPYLSISNCLGRNLSAPLDARNAIGL